MKKIKIFVGSSIVEFENERKDLELFIRRISDYFEDEYEIKLVPYFCENVDEAMATEGSQEEYNKLVKASDLAIFLFFNKVGKYTDLELNIAYEAFKANDNPKVMVFFKKTDDQIEEIRKLINKMENSSNIVFGTFKDLDTVNLRILLNLKLTEMKNINIKAIDGKITIDNQDGLINLNNVNEFKNNIDLNNLKNEYLAINEKCIRLETIINKDETKIDEYIALKSRAKSLKKSIDTLNDDILNLSLSINESMQKNQCTPKLLKAYKLFEDGDSYGALAILNQKDTDSEYARATAINQNKIKILIDENMFAIDMIKNNNGSIEDIEKRYKKIIPYIIKFNVRKEIINEYKEFLKANNKDDEIKELEKILINMY
ncbi:MAG: hypothetical protein K6A63_01340 [Acholeplasmatales bacterium]|nr:hypothetical protein [Acholeplasmatales bacterium]